MKTINFKGMFKWLHDRQKKVRSIKERTIRKLAATTIYAEDELRMNWVYIYSVIRNARKAARILKMACNVATEYAMRIPDAIIRLRHASGVKL